MKLMHFPAANNADVVLLLRSASLQGKALDILRRELRTLATAGRRLVLDLSAVHSLSSVAAQLIVEVATRLRLSGGSLKLTNITAPAAAFLELLRVPRSVEVEALALPLAA
jgi:anti-anti-sigma regulatory factor